MSKKGICSALCIAVLLVLLCGCSKQNDLPQKPKAVCNISMRSSTKDILTKSLESTAFIPELYIDRYTLPQVYGFYCKVNAALIDYANKYSLSLDELPTAYDYVVFYLNYKMLPMQREFPIVSFVEFTNEALEAYADGSEMVLKVTQSIRHLTEFGVQYHSTTDAIYIGKGNKYIESGETLWYLQCTSLDSSLYFIGDFLSRSEGEMKLDALLQALYSEWPDQHSILHEFAMSLKNMFSQEFFPDIISVQLVDAFGLDSFESPRTGKMLVAEDSAGNTYVYYEYTWFYSEFLCNNLLVALSRWIM